MRYLFSKHLLAAGAFTALAFAAPITPAQAQNTEMRDWSEIQRELEIIANNPELQKILKHPDVQRVLKDYQATVDNLKAQAKAEAQKKVDNTKAEAQAAVQDRWDMTIGKLIQDYQNSDIPRKLEQGDWSAIEETKALLENLDLQLPQNQNTSTGALDFNKE